MSSAQEDGRTRHRFLASTNEAKFRSGGDLANDEGEGEGDYGNGAGLSEWCENAVDDLLRVQGDDPVEGEDLEKAFLGVAEHGLLLSGGVQVEEDALAAGADRCKGRGDVAGVDLQRRV